MELIRRVSAVNPRTVVVLQCGSPVEMPWAEQPNAILLMYLSGERGGGACADLLLGPEKPQRQTGGDLPSYDFRYARLPLVPTGALCGGVPGGNLYRVPVLRRSG